MTLPSPDEVDRHVRALAKLVGWALDEHGHVARYRWAHSGLSGVRSHTAGSLGSPGHSDPVASLAITTMSRRGTDGDEARDGDGRAKQVEKAGNDLIHACKLVGAALDALEEKDRKRDTPTQLMRGWTPMKETEKLRENQARRQANGAGYGDS